jgi:hypothetical protein
MSKEINNITTKRFVIRKTLIGKNAIITFTNKKGEIVSYDHDAVYTAHQSRFDEMNCFIKYKSYTNSNAMPAFCRDLALSVDEDDSPAVEEVFTQESNGYV